MSYVLYNNKVLTNGINDDEENPSPYTTWSSELINNKFEYIESHYDYKIVPLTQAEYDALTTKDPQTLYLITD